MNKKRNMTTVFVSHDMHISSYGKRTLVLKDGKLAGDTLSDAKGFKNIFTLLIWMWGSSVWVGRE
jgi:ABC-type lipoprotein export system ATPase subunit